MPASWGHRAGEVGAAWNWHRQALLCTLIASDARQRLGSEVGLAMRWRVSRVTWLHWAL